MAEATSALRGEAFRLAVFGLYFDESRMFELIPIARAAALNRATPIVCVHGVRGRLTRAALRGIEETVRSMGCDWLDIAAIEDDAAGQAALRQALLRQLPAPPPSPAAGLSA